MNESLTLSTPAASQSLQIMAQLVPQIKRPTLCIQTVYNAGICYSVQNWTKHLFNILFQMYMEIRTGVLFKCWKITLLPSVFISLSICYVIWYPSCMQFLFWTQSRNCRCSCGACLPHGLCYHSRQGFRGIRQLLPRKSIATVGGVPRIPIWTGRKNMPLVPCGNPPCSVSYLAWWWSQAYGIKAESKLQSIIRLNSMPTPAVWKQHEAKAEYKKVKARASFWGLHIKTEDCPEIPVMNA